MNFFSYWVEKSLPALKEWPEEKDLVCIIKND